MDVRAAVLTAPRKVEVRKFPYPRVQEDDMVVKVDLCGICGTDQHLWLGELPNAKFPYVPGHETIGTIDKIGKGAAKGIEAEGKTLAEGDRVTWSNSLPCGKCYGCRWLSSRKVAYCSNPEDYGFDNLDDPRNKPWLHGGFAEYEHIKARSWVYKVPKELPTEVAVLMDTLVSVRGVETNMSTVPGMKEGFAQFDTVVIQGAGPVGVMAGFKAKALGAGKVIMVGGPAERLKLARRFGIDETINIDEVKGVPDRVAHVRSETDHGIGADMVVECTGFPSAMPEGIEMCREGGAYIMIGCWASRGTVGIDPSRIVTRELHIIGQRYASPQQHGRDLKFLTKYAKVYPFRELVTDRFPLEETKNALEQQGRFGGMKLAIDPWA